MTDRAFPTVAARHRLLPVALLALASGCYTYLPGERAALAPGREAALEINDAGRAQLSERLGPGVMRVEGTLVSMDSSAITMRVAKTRSIRGESSNWGGEPVTIRPSQVSAVFERRFSKGRTAAAVGLAVGGFAAIIAGRSLTGSSTQPGDIKQPPVGEALRR